MDVDGIEHLILKGATKILSNADSILVEINDDFTEQAEVSSKLLREAGLTLLEKLHSDLIEQYAIGFQNTYNQIWGRKS